MQGLADLYIVFLDNEPIGVVEYIGQGYIDRAQILEGVASITGEVSGLVVGGFAGKKLKANISQKTAGIKPVESGTGSYSLLPDEGEVGDNITPHHMPSAEYMSQHGVGKKMVFV